MAYDLYFHWELIMEYPDCTVNAILRFYVTFYYDGFTSWAFVALGLVHLLLWARILSWQLIFEKH